MVHCANSVEDTLGRHLVCIHCIYVIMMHYDSLWFTMFHNDSLYHYVLIILIVLIVLHRPHRPHPADPHHMLNISASFWLRSCCYYADDWWMMHWATRQAPDRLGHTDCSAFLVASLAMEPSVRIGYYLWDTICGILIDLPSTNQTWLAGKSTLNWGFECEQPIHKWWACSIAMLAASEHVNQQRCGPRSGHITLPLFWLNTVYIAGHVVNPTINKIYIIYPPYHRKCML